MAPSAASAAPAWLAKQTLAGADVGVTAPVAGADAGGTVTAAWVRRTADGFLVEQATRQPGGAFATTTLQTGALGAQSVVLAVNGRGDAILAWQRSVSGSSSEIWAAIRSGAGGAFGAPQLLASVPGRQVYDPNVAINEGGATMVVWRLSDGPFGPSETIYGAFRPAGGGFGSPQAISSTDPWNQSPRVVLDNAGRATVVWSFWNGGTCGGGEGCADNIARVRVRAPGGALGTQRDLSAGTPTGRPMFATVDVDDAGNAVAVWSRWASSVYEVQGSTRAAESDTWNALPVFGQSANASFGSEPQVTVAGDGSAVAIWRASNNTMQAASRAPGASFGAPQIGISAPAAVNPRIVLDAAGNAIAVWQRSDTDGSRVEAAVRPPGGQFGAVKVIATAKDATSPALAVDGLGNAFAVWTRDDPAAPDATDSTVEYAAYDASPPAIRSVTTPPTGLVGDPLGLSASTLDVWSPVTVGWTFGDGQAGTGETVDHTYGAPGTFPIGITATDAVGNASSAARSIQVAPKPPAVLPPPPAPVGLIGTTIQARLSHFRKHSTVRSIRLRRVPASSTVRMTCTKGARKGKGCPFKTKSLKLRKAADTLELTSRFNVKRKVPGSKRTRTKVARIAPGTRVAIQVAAPSLIGRSFTFAIRAGKAPTRAIGCLAPGGFAATQCPG